MMTATEIFNNSDGQVTTEYYKQLNALGPWGLVATAVFRAQKCSMKAKQYRKRSYTRDAYDRKKWSIGELVKILQGPARDLHLNWGWQEDPETLFDNHSSFVFYIDLPTGQISFHCRERGQGPNYDGEWDGQKGAGFNRVINFCDKISHPVVMGDGPPDE